MEINIENYLSEYEIKEIVKENLVDFIKQDKERIFYNAVSKYLSDEMDKIMGNDLVKELKDKAKNAIKNKDLSYELFRKPDAWDRSESYAYKILQKVCNDKKDILESKVVEIYNSIDKQDIGEQLSEMIFNLFKNNIK